MLRTVSLPVLVLFMGISVSARDLVTVAPDAEVEAKEAMTTPAEKPIVKPTIRALHINSDIKYRYATTIVSSRVVNPYNYSGQATFTVTLPQSAFISGFLMEVKGEVYKAYVKEKEEAKEVYNQAIQAGQFAGHVALDARDSNQFAVSVNLEAQGKVTFNLTYEELLSRKLGVYTNVININPQQIVEDMSITVNIEEPTAIVDLEVPELQMSNEAVPDEKQKQNSLAKIVEKSPNHNQVIWAPTPEEQESQNSTGISGQFIVKYDVDRKENPQQILVDEGYFVHFFAPENLPKLRAHVVFVLDYSFSMEGRKLEQLKDAMQKILSDLDQNDYFSIVIFHGYFEAWAPTKLYRNATDNGFRWEDEPVEESSSPLDSDFLVQATPANLDLAHSFLVNYPAKPATNIMGGLRTGLQLVNIGSEQWKNESLPPQPIVVFLTDGEPNVEEWDTGVIHNKTTQLNIKQCPIFSLGFGYDADFNFLRKLSLSNNGFAQNIYEAADASDQLKNFYRTIASPLLSNVTFTYLPGQVDNSSKTRIDFPIYFEGSELVVAGKMNNDPLKDKGTVGELSATTATGVRVFPITIDIRSKLHSDTSAHLEKAWAYLTIQQLLDKADSLDESENKNKSKQKALDLALQYSFVTPLTSLVVVKPNETESSVDTKKVRPGETPPPNAPSGISSSFAVQEAEFGVNGAGGSYMAEPLIVSLPVLAEEPTITYASPLPENLEDSATHQPESLAKKVALNDVTWLQQLLSNSSDLTSVPVSVGGHQYNLALNETDQSFGSCQVNSESGECFHFQHCALNIFKDSISDFLPYQCPITGDFLGVCCPKEVA